MAVELLKSAKECAQEEELLNQIKLQERQINHQWQILWLILNKYAESGMATITKAEVGAMPLQAEIMADRDTETGNMNYRAITVGEATEQPNANESS